MLLTQAKQWRRDSSATSPSFVPSFFTQRTPQTKTNITETTDGFTDGTRSRARWDFEELKGFIFFNSIWTVVFYSHPKMEVWWEVASIKWSLKLTQKDVNVILCTLQLTCNCHCCWPSSFLLSGVASKRAQGFSSEVDILESIRHVFFQRYAFEINVPRDHFSAKFLFAL